MNIMINTYSSVTQPFQAYEHIDALFSRGHTNPHTPVNTYLIFTIVTYLCLFGNIFRTSKR